jgi:uncharacterized protein DUF3499
MARVCSRPACNNAAVATFNFDGLQRVVWLAPLDEATTRSAGDLCETHAERFRAPRNWELRDTRTNVPSLASRRDVPNAPATPMLERAFRGAGAAKAG